MASQGDSKDGKTVASDVAVTSDNVQEPRNLFQEIPIIIAAWVIWNVGRYHRTQLQAVRMIQHLSCAFSVSYSVNPLTWMLHLADLVTPDDAMVPDSFCVADTICCRHSAVSLWRHSLAQACRTSMAFAAG